MITKERLYYPFEIGFEHLDTFSKRIYRNNLFKLIYIKEGTGIQRINDYNFKYQKGDMYLIAPTDNYTFTKNTTTTFFFLCFTYDYIESRNKTENNWVQRMYHVFKNDDYRSGPILKNKTDIPLVASLIECIRKEYDFELPYQNKIIQQIVDTLISIVGRNIASQFSKNIRENTSEKILDMFHYIQENIFIQKKLKVAEMSIHFKISQSYLGRYFKKQTGNTLQQYISNCKLRIIETRLLNSDMRIGEIANELGFTDESHLNRAFRKSKGLSPSEFKRKFS